MDALHPPAAQRHRRRNFLRLFFWLAALLLALMVMVVGGALLVRGQLQTSLADIRRISEPEGIDVLKPVMIGGIKQWISIRGHDRRNPVLLFIHGGPGGTAMPFSYGFQTSWEEHFTVVQWDQRGAGKTYTSNDPSKVGPTMTIPRMVQDAEEVVAYLRKDLGKDKIFVVGHSWGSIVGVNIAKRRPEWLHAYVGLGQAVNMRENERLSYEFALREARRRGDKDGEKALVQLAPYPPARGMPIDNILTQRSYVTKYGGFVHDPKGTEKFGTLALIAPEYSLSDLAHQIDGKSALFTLDQLLDPLMTVDLTALGYEFKTPIFIVNGRYDQETPSQLATDWFRKIEAPYKRLIWFDRSAHMPHFEETAKLSYFLINEVRPLAHEELDRFDPAAPRYDAASSLPPADRKGLPE